MSSVRVKATKALRKRRESRENEKTGFRNPCSSHYISFAALSSWFAPTQRFFCSLALIDDLEQVCRDHSAEPFAWKIIKRFRSKKREDLAHWDFCDICRHQSVNYTELFCRSVLFRSNSDDNVSQKDLSVLNLLVHLHPNLFTISRYLPKLSHENVYKNRSIQPSFRTPKWPILVCFQEISGWK